MKKKILGILVTAHGSILIFGDFIMNNCYIYNILQVSRQVSTASSTGRRSLRYQPNRVSRKDSVAKMAYDGVKHAVVCVELYTYVIH